jgi:phage head maturation protease
MVAPVGTWAQRGWWRWHAWDTDAFADLRRYRHKPVLLQWQHRSGVPLGISQSWDVDDTGNLWGTFMLGATPPAQAAAELATDGVLGLSLGATATTDWLAVVGVDEWDPYAAAVDVGLRRRPHLLEVSLTKNPVFDDCKVAFVD